MKYLFQFLLPIQNLQFVLLHKLQNQVFNETVTILFEKLTRNQYQNNKKYKKIVKIFGNRWKKHFFIKVLKAKSFECFWQK